MSYKKKGSVALPVQNIIGLVLAFMSVIVIFALFFGLMRMFVNPPSAGSTKSLSDFHEVVVALMDPKNGNSSCYWTVMFVEQNWAIAGFNKDGMRSTTTDTFCKAGGDCIEERCCNFGCNDVTKPMTCGTSPCICLCPTCSVGISGNCLGSLGSGDCSKKGASCKPVIDTPLERFYHVDKKYCTRTTSQVLGAAKGITKYVFTGKYENENKFEQCDLVYDSESCTSGWRKGVQKLVVVSRSADRKEIFFRPWSAGITWLKRMDPNIIDCRVMVRDMKKKPEVVLVAPPQEDKGTKVQDHLATVPKAR